MFAQTVTVDISPPEVLDAYVRLDVESRRHRDGARQWARTISGLPPVQPPPEPHS